MIANPPGSLCTCKYPQWYMKEKTRNWALVVAALTCPCHIALLPVLAAGTALGAILQAHLGWFFAGATLVFLGALTIAFWKPQEPVSASCKDGRCSADERAHRNPSDSPAPERGEAWQVAVQQ
jgi:hypothetical protein